MRYVGDQLGLHPLALDLFFYRFLEISLNL